MEFIVYSLLLIAIFDGFDCAPSPFPYGTTSHVIGGKADGSLKAGFVFGRDNNGLYHLEPSIAGSVDGNTGYFNGDLPPSYQQQPALPVYYSQQPSPPQYYPSQYNYAPLPYYPTPQFSPYQQSPSPNFPLPPFGAPAPQVPHYPNYYTLPSQNSTQQSTPNMS